MSLLSWLQRSSSLPGLKVRRKRPPKNLDAVFVLSREQSHPVELRVRVTCAVCGRIAIDEMLIPVGHGDTGRYGGRATKCKACGKSSLLIDWDDDKATRTTRFEVIVAGAVSGAKVRPRRIHLEIAEVQPIDTGSKN